MHTPPEMKLVPEMHIQIIIAVNINTLIHGLFPPLPQYCCITISTFTYTYQQYPKVVTQCFVHRLLTFLLENQHQE